MENIEFDDVVTEADNSEWTQVCDTHHDVVLTNGILSDIPIKGVICGIKDCKNEAAYYLDLNNTQ